MNNGDFINEFQIADKRSQDLLKGLFESPAYSLMSNFSQHTIHAEGYLPDSKVQILSPDNLP